MVAAAVVPAASELVMVYAGAVASGAFASAHVVLFGHHVSTPAWAYVTMALAGLAGNTLGSALGWGVGAYGGRPFLERHGRWLHVTPDRLDRAERWFDRFGPFAVLLGLSTPVIRSFIALPAGEGDERPDHRRREPEQHRERAEAIEPALGTIEPVRRDVQPAAVALEERTPAVRSDPPAEGGAERVAGES